jgi:ATP-dependent Clp protease ATP-binding subunit ClpA
VSVDRFDEPAHRVLAHAADEARRMGHPYVGTEHILLGLVADTEGGAGRAFKELGVTLDGARAQVTAEVPPSGSEPPGEIPLSPRARGTVEGAPRQAMGLKDDFVGTEHLLLSMLIERDSRTANVLTLLGAPPDLLRTTVLEVRQPRAKSPTTGLAPGLADAAREVAEARGASAPDAGDLMLALADRSAMLTRAFTELGITPQALRDAIQRSRSG